MGSVRVINGIDLLNANGERQLRIRPKGDGVTFDGDGHVAVFLNGAELEEFVSALSRIEANRVIAPEVVVDALKKHAARTGQRVI